MVFSFFKKPTQKMPERPAAKPRPAAAPPAEKLEAKPVKQPVKPIVQPPVKPVRTTAPAGALPSLDFASELSPPSVAPVAVANTQDFSDDEFDRDFSESSALSIDVEHGGDPILADVEQVVVLFANAQEAAARSLLEALIRSYQMPESKRFWLLLFDLLQVVGDRAAFEKLTVEYTNACETSPPTWREPAALPVDTPGPGGFVLQGVLTGDGPQPVAELAKLVAKKTPVNVDCGKLIGCDDDVAGQLAKLLSTARHGGIPLTLKNVEGLLRRLNERLVVGDATHAPSWALLLELLQRHGTQEAFEERAVDYAVTFELSPPSWEQRADEGDVLAPASVSPDDAYYFSGDLKNARFEELVALFELQENPILDFIGVRHMDFFSAGQLVNRLAPYKAAGRDVLIRCPNFLIAELMAVVGLNKQARIIVPKF